MARKLIVTSESALKAKYGEAGSKKVSAAVRALVKADAARGIETTLVALDGPALGGKKVKKAGKKPPSAAPFKTAIDAAFNKAGRPEYLVILGGPDVVPHQVLRNPVDDDDETVPSDLPYAGEGKAGDKAEVFVAASRAVGRIPDSPGGKDPRFLVGLLEKAAAWKPLPKKSYGTFFGLSAAEWKKSTTLSLQALFGKTAKTRLSPKEGPGWKRPDLAARIHFINCHGAPEDPHFYGQAGLSYPEAHHSPALSGLVKPGTVVAAECCYGGEVYAPEADVAGICSTYLGEGAIGFLGSTTVAYGPADSNSAADLLCRYFLEAVLGGASLGRALLAARHRFAQGQALNPVDLKTIAQFYLLGDPSLHPIATAATKAAPKKGLLALRAGLESHAAHIAGALECVSTEPDGAPPAHVLAALDEAAREEGVVRATSARTHEVRRPEAAVPKGGSPVALLESAGLSAKMPVGTRFHLMFAAPPGTAVAAKAGPGRGRITKSVCLLAREVGGSVQSVERLWARSGGHGEAAVRRPRRPKAGRGRLQE